MSNLSKPNNYYRYLALGIFSLILLIMSSSLAQDPAEADLAEGVALYESGDYDAAYAVLQDALDAFTVDGNRLRQADTLYQLGLVRFAQENCFDASTDLNRAWTIYQELDNSEGKAKSLQYIGRCGTLNNRFEDARGHYGTALNLAYNSNLNELAASILIDRATNYIADAKNRRSDSHLANQVSSYVNQEVDAAERDINLAINDYTSASELYLSFGELASYAAILVDRARAHQLVYSTSAAELDFSEAIRQFSGLNNLQRQAETLLELANIYVYIDEFDSAIISLDEADILFQELDDAMGINRVLALRGYVGYRQNFTGADQQLTTALTAQRQLGDNEGRMFTLRYLGEYALSIEEYNIAENYFNESIIVANTLENLSAEAWGLFGAGLASAQGNIGVYREALNQIDYGMVRFRDYLRDFRTLRYVNTLQAEFYLSRGEYDDSDGGEGAIILLQDSLSRAIADNDLRGQADSHMQLANAYIIMARDDGGSARVYTEWGDFGPALRYLNDAINLYERNQNYREQGNALLQVGELQVLSGRFEQANNTYTDALNVFNTAEYPIGTAQTNTQQARIAYLNGNERIAYQYLLDAQVLLDEEASNDLTEAVVSLALAEIQMNLGLLYLDANMFDEARDAFSQAEFTQINYDSSLQYLSAAYKGNLELAQDNSDSARSIFNQVLSSSNNAQASAIASRGLGIIAGESGNLNEMIDFFEDALTASRLIHDQVNEFDTFIAQGYVYLNLEDYTNSESLFASAEARAIGVNNPYQRAIAEYGFSQLFISQVENTERIGIAVSEANDAIYHATQTGGTLLQINLHRLLGDMYFNNADYDDAIEYYNNSRELALQEGYVFQESIANIRIALINERQRRFSLALNTLNNTQTQLLCLGDIEGATGCSGLFTDPDSLNPLVSIDDINVAIGVINRQFGDIHINSRQYSEASERLLDSERILSGLAIQYPQAEIELSYTRSSLGNLSLIQRNFSVASGQYEDAIRISERNNDSIGVALATFGLGRTYTIDNDPSNDEEGIDLINTAIVDFRSGALNTRLSQEAFLAQASYFYSQENIEEATRMYYQAISEAQNTRDPIGEALIHLQLGDLLRDTFQFSEAERIYETALTIFERNQVPLEQGEALYRLGRLSILRVDYATALDYFRDMELIFTNENDEIGIARSLNALGEVFYLQARYAQSLESHLAALNMIQNPLTIMNSMDDDITLGEELFSSLVLNIELETYQSIARVRLALADFESAGEALLVAQQLATQANNALILVDLELLEGQLQFAQGNYDAAIDTIGRAVDSYTLRDEGLLLAEANAELGRALLARAETPTATSNPTDDRDAAEDAYDIVQAQAREFGDTRLEIIAWLGLGRAYNGDNNETDAISNLSSAQRAAELVNSEELLIGIYIEFGLVYEKQNNLALAEQYYLDAIELIESVHSVMRVQTGQANFFAQNNVPYQRLVAYYIANGQDELALQYAERGRSRTFIYHANREQLEFGQNAGSQYLEDWHSANAQLADLYEQQNILLTQQQDDIDNQNSGLVDELRFVNASIETTQNTVDRLQSSIQVQETVLSQVVYINTPDLATIRQSLELGTTMIAYYVAPTSTVDEIYAFVITNEGYQAVILQPIVNLQDDILNARTSLSSVENYGFERLASNLFGTLVNHPDSFVSDAMANDNWVIAPHNALNILPFAALVNYALPERLINLQYTPSASFYVSLRERLQDVAPITLESSALVFGNPLNTTPLGEGNTALVSLPFAQAEAVDIAQIFNTDEFVESAAQEQLFLEQSRDYDILHIAAHGVFDPANPLSTYLLLANDGTGTYDGRLEVREIYTLPLQSRSPLVILSACDTNVVNLVDGDEFQGLARAFLVSGARGVVASLWRVDDEATSVLMTRFHTYVTEGDTPSVALARAQADIRNNVGNTTDLNWEAPEYWAAFVYIGV